MTEHEPTVQDPRIEALLAQMTTAEKLGQLTQYFYLPVMPAAPGQPTQVELVERALARSGAGSLLFVRDPREANRLQRLTVEGNRLGIPALFGFDVIHGLRTIFPVPVALAASWDVDTIERAQQVAAREARAVGIHWTFAPMVDITRDPRWGRIVEGAGEDPYLGSVVAAAQVRGFQGGDRLGAPGHVVAGPKHFAGYGASIGGRDYDQADISDADLWNVYLPPFRAAVQAGAGNVMSAYMDLNGVPATGNRWLLDDVLRGAFGFDGFVVSDANAVRDLMTHHYAADLADSGARALVAGCDMEMAFADPAFDHTAALVDSGALDVAVLDTAVRRVLRVKAAVGLLDEPYVDEAAADAVLADPAHRVVARAAAERSAVLLRNEGGLLPLAAERLTRVAVLGPLAASARDTLGPWVFDHDLTETVTIADGLRTRLAGLAEVAVAPGAAVPERRYPSIFADHEDIGPLTPEGFDAAAELARAVDLAAGADVAVVVVGERQDQIGEAASRSALDLPGTQLELLQAVVATGTPTVAVVMSGRPLDLQWAAEHVPAILQVWYPGTQGGAAVANLLLGDADPAGRLPFTWPRTVGQVPIHYAVTRSHTPAQVGERYWDLPSTPLFPFGHGLTYGTVEYRSIALDTERVARDGAVSVTAEVANTSTRDAVEVVQLYLHQRHGTSSRPVRLLAGFQRVALPAGTTQQVTFTVGPDQRRYWSAATRDWVLDATTFDVWVAPDAAGGLQASFDVD